MKVLLVKPPEDSRFNFGAFSLGVLAAAIRDLADISLLEATDWRIDQAVQQIASLEPDLVGVTVMGMTSVRPVAEFTRQLVSLRRDRRFSIVVGGHGASILPSSLLAAGADAVVLGEGEWTFREILESGISPGMPGLACLVDGRLMIGPRRPPIFPLDRLASPARDLMPRPLGGVHLMETSRGCPRACGFCEATLFHGRRWRPFSPARVAAEVQHLVQDQAAWVIHFADDNFAASPRRVLEICAALKQGPLPALILASARADDLIADPRLIPALAEAHISRLGVGIETLEDELGGRVGKRISVDTFQKAFARMREYGIFSMASLIVGLPGETEEMRARSVERAIEAGPDSARFLPFLPLPGTRLAEGHRGWDPAPRDIEDAATFTRAFVSRPTVRRRLEDAVAEGGIRGILADATLRGTAGELA